MLCLGNYMLQELQKPDFMFLATGPGSILEGANFFKKEYLRNIFAAKMKKNSSHYVRKIIT